MSAGEQTLYGFSGVPLALRGPAPTKVIAGFGFWLFLLSDIIMFAALFAAYAVLSDAAAGGPTGPELFEKPRVFLQTLFLLSSSVTCGFGTLSNHSDQLPEPGSCTIHMPDRSRASFACACRAAGVSSTDAMNNTIERVRAISASARGSR